MVLGLEQASSPCISSRIPAETHHVFKAEVLCGPSGFLLNRPSPVFGPPVTMQLPGGTWFLWPVFSFQYAAAFAGNTRRTRYSMLFLFLCFYFSQNLPQSKVSVLLLCLLRRKLTVFISLKALPRPQSGWFP